MVRRDVGRQLWMAQTAIGSIRRRRRREAMRSRLKGAYDATGKTDEEVLEELIGPNWREIVLGERAGEGTSKDGGFGTDEETRPNGTDEYWDEVRRVNRADDLAARKPIAVPSDGSGSFSYAESEKTPIVTPESWGKADDGTGFGLR